MLQPIPAGWDEVFARPLGDPLGAAKTRDGVMSRTFSSGTKVQWTVGSEADVKITWADPE